MITIPCVKHYFKVVTLKQILPLVFIENIPWRNLCMYIIDTNKIRCVNMIFRIYVGLPFLNSNRPWLSFHCIFLRLFARQLKTNRPGHPFQSTVTLAI